MFETKKELVMLHNKESVYLWAKSPENHYGLEHSHTHHEFFFVERGSLLNVSEGKTVKLIKNDIVIMRPECTHKLLFDKKSPYLFFNLEINTEFLKNLLSSLGHRDIDSIISNNITYLRCSDDESFELMKLVNLATKYPIESAMHQFYLKLIVVNLLTKHIAHTQNRLNDQSIDSPIINSIVSELSKSENFLLSTNEICKKLNYSQEYIIRLFKKANLDTPNKIFLKNKLNYACTYLKTSNLKVVDIAEMCGIYTISYFNKAFKKEFGVSPSQYRKTAKLTPPPTHFIETNE